MEIKSDDDGDDKYLLRFELISFLHDIPLLSVVSARICVS